MIDKFYLDNADLSHMNEKEYYNFIYNCIKYMKHSYEYRSYMKYINEQLSYISIYGKDAKAGLYFYPLSLSDIVDVIITRYKSDSYINEHFIASKLMELIYKEQVPFMIVSKQVKETLDVGLIEPKLCTTEELEKYIPFMEDNRKYISADKVDKWNKYVARVNHSKSTVKQIIHNLEERTYGIYTPVEEFNADRLLFEALSSNCGINWDHVGFTKRCPKDIYADHKCYYEKNAECANHTKCDCWKRFLIIEEDNNG